MVESGPVLAVDSQTNEEWGRNLSEGFWMSERHHGSGMKRDFDPQAYVKVKARFSD